MYTYLLFLMVVTNLIPHLTEFDKQILLNQISTYMYNLLIMINFYFG